MSEQWPGGGSDEEVRRKQKSVMPDLSLLADRPWDIVGLAEVAERLHVTTSVVSNWRKRKKDFPKPDFELRMGPIFDWQKIMAWLATHPEHHQSA